MGENGCGKTLLIKVIAKLLKSKIKILNIHPDISNQDIITLMEGKINNIKLVENINEDKDNKLLLEEAQKELEEIEETIKLFNETEKEFENYFLMILIYIIQ